MRAVSVITVPLVLFAAYRVIAAPPPASVRVDGDVIQPRTWTAPQIEKELGGYVETVRYTFDGRDHTARAVPLVTLVQAARPRTTPGREDSNVRFVVVLRAADNYTVSFGLGELLPTVGKRAAWLAFQVDGGPLPERQQPFALLIPGETNPSRWIYGVTSITTRDGANLGQTPDE